MAYTRHSLATDDSRRHSCAQTHPPTHLVLDRLEVLGDVEPHELGVGLVGRGAVGSYFLVGKGPALDPYATHRHLSSARTS